MTYSLPKVLDGNAGRKTYEMKELFERLIQKGKLQAYEVEIDKRHIEKDTEEEMVIRIKKGVTLIPLDKIGDNKKLILKDTKGNFYHIVIESSGSEDGGTSYHLTRIDKLSGDFNPEKHIRGLGPYNDDFMVIDDLIKSRLVVNFEEKYNRDDELIGTEGKFRLDGDFTDRLVKTALRFVKSRRRNK